MAIKSKMRSDSGASLVEIVIGLPLVLAVILFLLWLVSLLNTRTGFQSAVVNGARLAVTRGNSPLIGFHAAQPGGLIQDIEDWRDGLAPLPSLLYHTVEQAEAVTYYNDHTEYGCGDGFCGSMPGGSSFVDDYPPSYHYALVYIYEGARQAVGDFARYPCDPTEPVEGDGCIRCRFLHPLYSDDDFWGDNADEIGEPLPDSRIHIQCQARMFTSFLRPVFVLLGGNAADFGLLQYTVAIPLIGQRP